MEKEEGKEKEKKEKRKRKKEQEKKALNYSGAQHVLAGPDSRFRILSIIHRAD